MTASPIEAQVLRTRATLATAFVLARYAPLPFLDDFVRERVARQVVSRAAASLGHALAPAEIARLAAPTDGCLGCLGAILWAPLRMLFFPVALVLGLRFASRDLVEIFALGRTVERILADGRFPLAAPVEERLVYARDVRLAFDAARRGLDTHAVSGVLSVALGPIRRMAPAALRVARRAWSGDETTEAGVEAPASRLAAALDDPRVRELLEKIDTRFDQELLTQRARS